METPDPSAEERYMSDPRLAWDRQVRARNEAKASVKEAAPVQERKQLVVENREKATELAGVISRVARAAEAKGIRPVQVIKRNPPLEVTHWKGLKKETVKKPNPEPFSPDPVAEGWLLKSAPQVTQWSDSKPGVHTPLKGVWQGYMIDRQGGLQAFRSEEFDFKDGNILDTPRVIVAQNEVKDDEGKTHLVPDIGVLQPADLAPMPEGKFMTEQDERNLQEVDRLQGLIVNFVAENQLESTLAAMPPDPSVRMVT